MNGNTKLADLTVNEFIQLMRELRQDEIAGRSLRTHQFSWEMAHHPQGCECNDCCQMRAAQDYVPFTAGYANWIGNKSK